MFKIEDITTTDVTEEYLDGLAKSIRRRLNRDYDAVIAVCGYEGDGKSTLAIKLASKVDKNFTLQRNVLFNPTVDTVTESVLRGLPKGSAIVVDEAIKVLYKRGFMNKLQIFLNQIFAICRGQNKCIILCMPEFSDFDSFFRQHRILVWIQLLERGNAVAFVKTWNIFTTDKWNLKANEDLIAKVTGKKSMLDLSTSDKLNMLRRSANYFVDFTFSDLTPDMQREYKELKGEINHELDYNAETGRASLYRNALAQLYLLLTAKVSPRPEQYSQLDLSKVSGLSVATINNILREHNARRKDLKTSAR